MSQVPPPPPFPAGQPVGTPPAGGPPPQGSATKTVAIVLSIIGVLMVLICGGVFLILMPALGKAKEAAKATVALSNARQLMVAVHSYATDFKDRVPANAGWADTLNSYLGGGVEPMLDSRRIDGPGPDFVYAAPPGRKGRQLLLSEIRNPSTTIFFHEDLTALPPSIKTVVVAYADGAVKLVPRAELEQALAAQAREYPPDRGE
ncbi:MAG: hypothetical protein DYG92_08185 [Leptolyngbya sp. PLA1]|nr:hypothetical protein [Leptolyngbya sp. PLA1]